MLVFERLLGHTAVYLGPCSGLSCNFRASGGNLRDRMRDPELPQAPGHLVVTLREKANEACCERGGMALLPAVHVDGAVTRVET